MANYTQEFKQKIIQEYKTDKTLSQISRENKIAISTIYKWLKISQTPRKPIKYTKELKQKIIQEYSNGKTTKQIAEENNIPKSTIHGWIEVLPNQILKTEKITSHKTKSYQSLVTTQFSPNQQKVELSPPEKTQNTISETKTNPQQQCSLPINFSRLFSLYVLFLNFIT